MDPQPLFSEEFLRKLERLEIVSRRSIAGRVQGEQRSPKRGQSVEFSDFRLYAPGDDIRRIDWNAYARLDRLFIKLFVEEQDQVVHLLIDTSRSMDWGKPNKLQFALRTAAALGYVILAGADRLKVTALGDGRRLNNRTLQTIRGKRSAMALFDFLSNLSAQTAFRDEGSLSGSLLEYALNALLPGPLVLFSDLMDDGWQPGLNRLAARHFEVTLIHILSPDELNPEFEGDFKLQDSEKESEVEITADFELISLYRQNLADWQESWRKFCAARDMHYIPVDTSLPLEDLLFAWLPRQGILK